MIEGLERALEIIQEEKEYAIKTNLLMAMGMSQVQELIQKEITKLKESK